MSGLHPFRALAQLLTGLENGDGAALSRLRAMPAGDALVVGITGPPGAGKSSLVDALTAELRARGDTVAILAVDPSSRRTGGAILGDRVRMQRHHSDPGVFIRSMGTRGAHGGIAEAAPYLSRMFSAAAFRFVLLETVGVGQDEVEVAAHADVTLVVLVPGMGDDVQTIKAGVMEIADIFVINKADRPGANRLRQEIEAMLSLGEGHGAPEIFETIATEGTGLPQLVDALSLRTKKQRAAAEESWAIDHLGIAVRSIDEALAFYKDQLGMSVAARETVAHERVHTAMLPAGTSRIELLEPSDDSSTIAKFLGKRGPGLHHVAMKVADLHGMAERLEAAGCKLLGKPRRGAGGHLYVFVHPASSGGVLWELIQS